MSVASDQTPPSAFAGYLTAGMFWLLAAAIAALLFFQEGFNALFTAWQLPEYSHGPLIPVLSLLLFLRQLKSMPIKTTAVTDQGPGIALLIFAVLFGMIGKFSQIDEVVAYAIILWVGAILLICWGWQQGKHFWPPVVHLVYMLPLPGLVYYKLSTFLQVVSSELGVWMLQLINVPVFLEGNIIDFGVYKLHVAEACSGLRYLFPIMSFSYVFAVLFKGTIWHKAVLLLAAVPITIVMNSARIAFAGWLVNYKGLEYLQGFTHFFEGWIIFMICVVLLFLLAWAMLRFSGAKMGLVDALDLDITGWAPQVQRVRLVAPTRGLIFSAVLLGAAATAWEIRPQAETTVIAREPFVVFPSRLGDWKGGIPEALSPDVALLLNADDYLSVQFTKPETRAPVELFVAWYDDQTKGGTHSPEVCLPGAGWEIAEIERMDIAPQVGFAAPYNLNRAVIQKGQDRMLAYYWFEQHGRHTAWDFAAKMYLLWDSLTVGRTDGALVRLITPILPNETEAEAEVRLQAMFLETTDVLPRFVPGLDG